jgi:orotate phosphoribosyltransferase
MHEYEVAKLLLKIGAVSLRPDHPYRLASGILSPIYIDSRILNSYPDERKIVFDHFQDYIDSFIGRNNITLVVGIGHSGASLAAYLVEKMRLPMAYIRASTKDHGKENQIEGLIPPGSRVLLISDIIDDSGHIPISVQLLRERGVEIVHVLCIFNLKLDIADRFLKEQGIRYFTLTDLRVLLNIAASEKLISLVERDEIEKWRKSYLTWGETREAEMAEEARQRQEEVARILLEIKAVTLSPSKPYRYVSGIYSPIYCDNRLLMSYPDQWQYIINSMLKIIVNVIGTENTDIICGTSTAGIPHAAYISDRLKKPMIYVKGAAEEHGKKSKIEGKLAPGSRVVVIEDLISTGGSSIRAVESVRDAGGTVDHCLAIFTYEMEQAARVFREGRCALHTLTCFSTLIAEAQKRGAISREEAQKAVEWNRAPTEWGKRMGFE